MWPYHTGEEHHVPSAESEIRRVVDALADVGDQIGVNEEGRVEGTARRVRRDDQI